LTSYRIKEKLVRVVEAKGNSIMEVTYFRPQRDGPEAAIQEAVATRLTALLPPNDRPVWTAGSLPIGAGMPDLVAVSYEPEVIALANAEMGSAEVLAYLRAVNRAKLDTIVDRIARPRTTILRCLEGLLEVEAVHEGSDTFELTPVWRAILPEILTVEAKVKNWRDAIGQAARNRIFAHRSFVALPERLATRIRREPVLSHLGIGLLAVGEAGSVQLMKRARRTQPKVWTYYYKLASFAAAAQTSIKDKKEGNAVHCPN
jgi:hypothetical protein